jgi:hypothetical protein
MKKKASYFISGPPAIEADLTNALKQYRAAHPGCWFAILYAEDKNYYVYGFPTGRSHRAVRNRATRLHEQQKLAWTGCSYAIGKCHKSRCRCGGRTYISQALRLPDIAWCSGGGDSRPFADDDLDGMLAYVFQERRGYDRLNARLLPA